ncbi:IclR family transcriptional regulator [Phyllobacterium sp. SB3]|uniref:IclR family transcriptional regulator n=1 Tax=Phyllobacterium sp. SB3 TaxID=3156073 RepID=UPI0032AEE194
MTEMDTNISATAVKALAVLDFMGEQHGPITVQEAAQGLSVDRATAYRMLLTLVHAGYVMRDNVTKNYRLSFKVLSLSRNLMSEDERSVKIVACLRKISDLTGETVHYSALERDAAVLVFRAKGSQRVAVDFQIGDRSALHCTSIGKVLLAYQDIRATEAIIAGGLWKVAPRTITDPDELRRELARVRAQGYAYDDLEFAPDMRCVAVPVFESGGNVPGGIAISGPSSRFDHDKLEVLRDIALREAATLSKSLGGIR